MSLRPPHCRYSYDSNPGGDGEVCLVGEAPLLLRSGGGGNELLAGGGCVLRGVGSRGGRSSWALLAREGQQSAGERDLQGPLAPER